MFESLRMILMSGTAGGAAIASALIMAPVAIDVLSEAPVGGPMASREAPAEGARVALFSVVPGSPASGVEVAEMAGGQSDGAVSLDTRVLSTL